MEIKGYITNLGKYNEGALIGKWITFPIDEDELNEILKEIGCCYEDENGERRNEYYEEFFFTDWECEIDLDLSEYERIDYINEIAETIENWDEWERDTFAAAVEIWGLKEVLEHDINDYFLNRGIEDDYDLGEYYAKEACCIDFGENSLLERYFDFEAYGRDIRLESDGGHTRYGWIERC